MAIYQPPPPPMPTMGANISNDPEELQMNQDDGDNKSPTIGEQKLAQWLKDAGLGQYTDFFGGDISKIADKLGLSGKQAEMFAKFIRPFQRERFDKLIGSIEPYRQEQEKFLGRQYDIGQEAARSGLSQSLSGLRQNLQLGGMQAAERSGGFAGAGAQQSALQLARDVAGQRYGGLTGQYQTRLSDLGLTQERGLSALDEKIEGRKGQVYGLLGDYMDRVLTLGQQFLQYDPAGGGYGGQTTGGGGGYGG